MTNPQSPIPNDQSLSLRQRLLPLDPQHHRVQAAADSQQGELVVGFDEASLDGEGGGGGEGGGTGVAEKLDGRVVAVEGEAEAVEEQVAVGLANLVRDDAVDVVVRPAE